LEEAKGVKVLEPATLPRLHAWAKNFVELPVVKENTPAYDKMLAYRTDSMKRLAKS
jgi:glutathione S-transferase